MEPRYTLEGLAGAVNAWCEEHGVVPASGQSGERVTPRNVRYYRTLGLVDGPVSAGDGYGEKHLLQLVAIRLLQAQGLPLNRVRDLLFGRTLEELREVRRRGLAEVKLAQPTRLQLPVSRAEAWGVTPLDDEFLVISRQGRRLSEAMCVRLREVLQNTPGLEQVNRH